MQTKKDCLIKEISYECPVCDINHKVEIRKRFTKVLVRKEPVEYEQIYYYCSNEDEEFVPSRVMDENLLRSRDAYRNKNGLLTSGDIKRIREYYNLTQKEFANMFGWGDVTVQRYETKLIQDETYDHMIRMVGEDPVFAIRMLDSHSDKYNIERFKEIRNIIKSRIKEKGNKLLKIQEIKTSYIDFEEESDFNGFKRLDIDKVTNVLGFFVQYSRPLFKVKLMKLLWYSDALFFKKYERSMMGLVYKHLPLGAVPIAFNAILSLPSISVEEEYINDYIAYKIFPGEDINITAFSLEEIEVLQEVAHFFKNKNTQMIVNYMHEERAYKETELGQIMPYSLAKDIRDF